MTNTFKIEFNVDNAAFFHDDGHFDPYEEVRRILAGVGRSVGNGSVGNAIHDSNGNKIGSWSMDVPDDPEEDGDICPDCNGSGEGMYDGTTCRKCNGKGSIE